jgi:hypothetical protein
VEEQMKVDARTAATQRRLAAQLAEIGFALPVSLTVKAYRCGKQNCRCRADPPKLHGPYAFWTRKVNAKTQTRMLSDEELADYQPMFDNARKIRDLVSELQELSLELVERDTAARKAVSKPQPTKLTKLTEAVKTTRADSARSRSPRARKATAPQRQR